MMVRKNVVVLIDEDITQDKRVLASLAAYPNANVIDCTVGEYSANIFDLSAYMHAGIFLLQALFRGIGIWPFLNSLYGLQVKEFSAGLRVSVRSFIRARQVAANLRSSMGNVTLIHAHDLFCGLIGADISRITGAELIYDAHEVEFHRNRKNSWLRTAFDVTAEKMVMDRACEVRVVNRPIAVLYERIHDIPTSRIRVVPNDHFASHPCGAVDTLSAFPAAFVYVGGGVRGRQLDKLAVDAMILGVHVYGFFIYEVPKVAIANGWILGSSDYEEELIAVVASHRCVMWCCVDDVCLSYRLALPNKFFQALAVGIPVIASHGTYLAEIVTKYQLGAVFNGTNLQVIVEQMNCPVFEEWVASVLTFRADLQSGNVVI